jgi:hypothetical protein
MSAVQEIHQVGRVENKSQNRAKRHKLDDMLLNKDGILVSLSL